ncbi:MAG: hypothetical protein GY934_01665, partial [Gammaproteobacteria bacterium]|nr:hypothetical protein [Gammaproteobacteria bacterium]
QAGTPPVMTLEDGTVIPGVEIVGLIENPDYDKIATAAGDPGAGGQGGAGGGAGFTADPSGLLGDDIGHGPYAGGIALADQVGFTQVPGALDPGSDDLPFEAIDDHVIPNIQAGPGDFDNYIDIPDVALRHNDIYPRGEWDLTSVSLENPWPHNPSQANFEDQMVVNTTPDNGVLESTDFSGSNTTARFAEGPVADAYDNNGDAIDELVAKGLAGADGVSVDPFNPVKVTRQNWDLAATNLHTIAPTSGTPSDWDGASIYLYAGETITLTSEMNGSAVNAILAIDDPNVSSGSDPLGTQKDLNWDVTNAVDSISVDGATGQISSDTGTISTGASVSYAVETSGWYYVGTGFANGVVATGGTTTGSGVSPSIKYNTLIEIDG